MKRSVGLLRHAPSVGRQTSLCPLQSPLLSSSSSATAFGRAGLRRGDSQSLCTSAVHLFPLPSTILRSEQAINPATSSSSTSNNNASMPPLSPKKRSHPPTRSNPQQSKSSSAKRSPTGATPSAADGLAKTKTDAKASSTASKSTVTSSTQATTAISSSSPQDPQPPKRTLLDRIKGLWENIKYLFRFYYQGTKQIWKDRKIVADLKKRIAAREAEGGEGIQWIENAVVKRHEADLRKLPLFLAILLILEEILPLVVIYAPSLLPSTCVLPSQSTKMRSKEERIRGLAIQSLARNDDVRAIVDQLVSQAKRDSSEDDKEAAAASDRSGVQQPSLQLATLDSKTVSEVAQLFALRTWGPRSMVKSRIENHLAKLQMDDTLLRRAFLSRRTSSQWKEFGESEWLWNACAQRGLRAFDADSQVMEYNLIAYLHLTAPGLSTTHHSLLPLALYDGTLQGLVQLQGEADQEASKGLRRRTREVVEEVKETAKRKEESGQ